MRAHPLPPAAGWGWLLGAIALYRRNPAALALLVMAYWFIVLLLNIVPLLGTLAASLLIPGLSVGIMQGCRNLERGQPVHLATLFGALRQNGATLAKLGGLYLFVSLGSLGMSALVDGGQLLQVMLGAKDMEPEMLESGELIPPSLLVMALLTPVLMAYWYAPILAAWHGQSVAKSLFFSLVACWLNWRPFLVYGLGLFVIGVLLPSLFVGILMMIPGLGGSRLTLLLLPMSLVVAPIVYASFYTSYRDVFSVSEHA